MKKWICLWGVAAATIAFFAMIAHPAQAQVLFTSGPSIYDSGAEDINDFTVSDSFKLTSTDVVTGVDAAIWTDQADSLTNVGYAITSGIDTGTVYSTNDNATVTDGTILSSSNEDSFQVEEDSFLIPSLTLPAGTYYLSLYNPTTESGDYAYWDDVTSATTVNAYESAPGYDDESTNPSTFQIDGHAASLTSTPEPSPLISLLLGSGALIVFAAVRRVQVTNFS